jgi:hypothetical protein
MDIVQHVAAVAAGWQNDLGDVLDGVAGVAVETLVGPGQRVFGLGIVIEAPAGPAVRVVTERAIGAQAPLVKLVLVAARASRSGVLERSRAVALLAGHDRMATDQRKSREVVIERDRLAPIGIAVTLLAAGSQAAFVGIILLVAGHAARRHLVAKEIAGVAEVAFDSDVAAAQRKSRPVMIEPSRRPLRLVVAVLAFGTIASQVNVLQAVAFHAAGGNIAVALAGMARRAIDRPVRTLERKLGRVVIERLHVQPDVLAVALVAFLAQLPLVRITRLMTVEAEAGRFAKFGSRDVTIIATRRLVGALQAKIRNRVIESLAIELHDVGTSALVVGMADPAFLLRRIELATVKAAVRQPIRCDLLVAFEALAGLRLPREGRVTTEAFVLELGMPFDERTRHDQPLQHVLRSGRPNRRHREKYSDRDCPRDPTPQCRDPDQNRCAATTWIAAANTRMKNKGRCSTCQRPNRRS